MAEIHCMEFASLAYNALNSIPSIMQLSLKFARFRKELIVQIDISHSKGGKSIPEKCKRKN